MRYTDEQTAIIKRLAEDQYTGNIKIIAYAGTGKTTTLQALCRSLPDREILNLSFNRSVAQEASSKFPSNVTCETFHGVAYTKCAPVVLAENPKAFTEYYKELSPETPFYGLWGAYRTLVNFCGTTDPEITKEHAKCEGNLDRHARDMEDNDDYAVLFAEIAKSMWDLYLENPESPALHCMYLKKFISMDDMNLNEFDLILIDEAQDANPSMLGFLSKVKCQIVIVGDPYQQIYEFNGAINALDACKFETHYLTKSFRFGDAVADLSNNILKYTKDFDKEHPLRGKDLELGDTEIVTHDEMESKDYTDLDSVVCRTNRECYEIGMEFVSMNIAYCFGNKREALRELKIIRALKSYWAFGTKYMGCSGWPELMVYASEATSDLPYAWIIHAVEKGDADFLESFLNKSTDDGVFLTTAHRAKGLEWGSVMLSEGFMVQRKVTSEEEYRLFYVAATRAIDTLYIKWRPYELKTLMDDFKDKLDYSSRTIDVKDSSDILKK